MIHRRQRPRLVVHEDEEDEGDHDSSVEDDDGLPPACLDARGQEAGDEEPDQRPEEDQVCYEEPEGHEIQHGLKACSPRKRLFTMESTHNLSG